MSYARTRVSKFELDWLTGALVALVLAFQGTALLAANLLLNAPTTPERTGSYLAGLEVVAIAAVEIVLIVVCWRLYGRLPECWQTRVRGFLKGAMYGIIASGSALILYWLAVLWLFPVAVAVVVYLKRRSSSSGLKWILFNLAGFALGLVIIVSAGFAVEPRVILLLMGIAMVYDYFAVDLSSIMGDLVAASASMRLPNMLIIPTSLRFDFGALREFLRGSVDDKPTGLAMVIGVGDFVIPSILLVSVFVSYESLAPPVLGIIAGTVVAMVALRDASEHRDGGLPALPWLNSGAIAGYAVGVAVLMV